MQIFNMWFRNALSIILAVSPNTYMMLALCTAVTVRRPFALAKVKAKSATL